MGVYKVIQVKIPKTGAKRNFRVPRRRRRWRRRGRRMDVKRLLLLVLAVLLLCKGAGLLLGRKDEKTERVQWEKQLQTREEEYPQRRKGIFFKDVMPFYGG